MKKNENQAVYTFIIALITAFAVLSGISIGMSKVLVNSKYGFIGIVIVAAGIAVYKLICYRENQLHKEYFQQYKSALDETEKYKKRTFELAEERDTLETQLHFYTAGYGKESFDNYKKKAEALENFRNSFPLKVSENYVIYAITRIELNIDKYSKWHIVGAMGDELWDCTIIRPDTQTYKDMITLLSGTKHYNEIPTLTSASAILWE